MQFRGICKTEIISFYQQAFFIFPTIHHTQFSILSGTRLSFKSSLSVFNWSYPIQKDDTDTRIVHLRAKTFGDLDIFFKTQKKHIILIQI